VGETLKVGTFRIFVWDITLITVITITSSVAMARVGQGRIQKKHIPTKASDSVYTFLF